MSILELGAGVRVHALVKDECQIILSNFKSSLSRHPPLEHREFLALFGTRHPYSLSASQEILIPNTPLRNNLVE